MMSQSVNLSTARQNLSELTDRAYAGQTFVVARRGRELAVLIGIDEYRRLKEMERDQRHQDFNVLLAPPGPPVLPEDEAREVAIQTVRQVRASKRES